MSVKLLLLLMVALLSSEGSEIEFTSAAKDENSEYDLLCSEQSVTLNFTNLRLDRIDTNFVSSPLIKCLDLRNNGIQDLGFSAFDNLPNLKFLEISYNSFNLNNILNNNNFYNLEIIMLDGFFDEYFEELEITGLYPKLRKIFLRDTFLSRINVVSKDSFPSLTHLYLSNSKLTNDNFDWLPESLEYLDLTGHNLQSLTLKNLKNLKQLFIDNPDEKHLSQINFENLINLKYLSLPSNVVSEISSSTFSNITSLLYLDLSDNEIQYIEEGALDSMQNLQFVNLSGNKLEIIPFGTLNKLHNLKTLILEKNRINIFTMIGKKPKLESLKLNCNQIKSISKGTFIEMPELKFLFLHENEISYIDVEAFKGLSKLKVLTLSNNKLAVLPYNWMIPMINLEDLDLAKNNLIDFGNLALSKTSILKNLYLSKQIQFIHAQALLNVPENVTINFNEDYEFVEKCFASQGNNGDRLIDIFNQ